MTVFSEKIKSFFGISRQLTEEAFEDLADLLVEGDFGALQAASMTDMLNEACKREKISDGEGARNILAKLLEEMLLKAGTAKAFIEQPASTEADLQIALILGVNGVGKTTTAAKLANLALTYNRRPILAAADTFRAAAIDQIKIHGERLGVRVIAHQQGGDPAAVIYDALEAAIAGAGNLIIADTAGRMHTKTSLVEELKKIDRVVESKAQGCRYMKYLVLDATTGRNAVAQAEAFHGAVLLDGIILAKFDSSGRGGAVFSLAEDLGLPLAFLCTGEKYGDIETFDPHVYAQKFTGLA